MYPSEAWEDGVHEDFFIYLEKLDPDISPMDFKSFLAFKLKQWEWEAGEQHEPEKIYF